MTIIDQLLQEQQSLTAVDRFASRHNSLLKEHGFYRDLIPLTRPHEGEQYAFEVDLDQCNGCKACVTACHNLNGLESEETWRSVGLLTNPESEKSFSQTVTSACHHCSDPACLNGCPTLAYEKNPVTGIVKHLDDQCFGCQYCILKCPYDVPKYEAKRGIVRKCDMCSSRLEVGEAPACVQACPTQAIRIVHVKQGEASRRFISGTVERAYTLPTTRYVGRRADYARLIFADHEDPQPQHSHPSLIGMLLLTQASVGTVFVGWLGNIFEYAQFSKKCVWTGTLLALVGMIVGLFHLGRPQYAWKAFLGWRKSWLSREVIAFGAYFNFIALISLVTLVTSWTPPLVLLGVGVNFGMAGVFCSAMIYHDTRREWWKGARTIFKFFGSTLLLGSVAALLIDLSDGLLRSFLPAAVLIAGILKLSSESFILRKALASKTGPFFQSARLCRDILGVMHRGRVLLGIMGAVLIPTILFMSHTKISSTALFAMVTALAILTFLGEWLERELYFRAAAPWKMPGGYAS